MKQLKNKIIPILVSVTISYLLNCYYYNTFNSSLFPVEAKITTTILLILAIFIFLGVIEHLDSEYIDEIKQLKEQLKLQTEDCKHDWQTHKYSSTQEQCIKCKGERGKI